METRTNLFTTLTPTSDLQRIILAMGEGNAGGINVMARIMKHQGRVLGFETLRVLDDMNIRGMQIWVGYQYFCDGSLDAFLRAVESRSPTMVAYINRRCLSSSFTHEAKVSGAAGTRPAS